ncbi:Uncharacterised protein [Buttiauxella agrestis]|uniref:Uncharacterized protein n=1 Tax=Buttiauxella agrestis TaxID=82977 RepID=A0A381KQP8_9ENTR|nr:Uncharacterised protein [Buttiauxella agrestis]
MDDILYFIDFKFLFIFDEIIFLIRMTEKHHLRE